MRWGRRKMNDYLGGIMSSHCCLRDLQNHQNETSTTVISGASNNLTNEGSGGPSRKSRRIEATQTLFGFVDPEPQECLDQASQGREASTDSSMLDGGYSGEEQGLRNGNGEDGQSPFSSITPAASEISAGKGKSGKESPLSCSHLNKKAFRRFLRGEPVLVPILSATIFQKPSRGDGPPPGGKSGPKPSGKGPKTPSYLDAHASNQPSVHSFATELNPALTGALSRE
jgi:hypothetical protein